MTTTYDTTSTKELLPADQQNTTYGTTAQPQAESATSETTKKVTGISNNLSSYQMPEGASVESRLNSLLQKDNPYLARARTSAQQTATARGLQNSTMAASAGEASAIDAGYQIANADAANFANLYNEERSGQIQNELYKTQGAISKDLELAKIEATNQWEQQFLNQKIALEQTQLDASNKEVLGNMMTDLQSDYQASYQDIMLTKGLTNTVKTNMLNQLNTIYKTRMDNISKIYGVELVWQTPKR